MNMLVAQEPAALAGPRLRAHGGRRLDRRPDERDLRQGLPQVEHLLPRAERRRQASRADLLSRPGLRIADSWNGSAAVHAYRTRVPTDTCPQTPPRSATAARALVAQVRALGSLKVRWVR